MPENFEPLIGYHGSCREITRFSSFRYEGVGGIYFTQNKDEAWEHAEDGCIEEGDIPTLMTAKLNVKNPARLGDMESHELSLGRISQLKANGFDAVFGVNDDGDVYEIVVFDPEQVDVIEVDVRLSPEDIVAPMF